MRPRPARRPAAASLVPVVLLALLAGVPGSASAAPVRLDSRITQVTVYGDRADVRRVAAGVRLVAGGNALEIAGLPRSVDPASFRASGQGDDRVAIVNLDVSRSDPPPPALTDGQQREIAELEARVAQLEARKLGIQAGEQFLRPAWQSARSTSGESRLLQADGAAPEKLRATLAFLVEAVEENRRAAVETDAELERARAAIREIRAGSERRDNGDLTWTVRLELDAPAATEVDVALDYTAHRASWTADYDVIVPDDLRTLRLIYGAKVQQQTGEDWKGVEITLSSAQPSLGALLPQLTPWWLAVPAAPVPAPRPEIVMGDEAFVRGGRSSDVQTAVDQLKKEESMTIRRIDGRSELKVRAIHTTEEAIAVQTFDWRDVVGASGTFATSFPISAPQDLPSDGRSRRLRIAAVDLEAKVVHESVPKESPHAFLVATARNDSGLPLLAGGTRIRLGGAFVGEGDLENTAPGQELRLALGVDPSVSVERKTVARRDDGSGDRRETSSEYRIEVRNHRTVPVKITLHDQVPVSPDKDVSVRVRDVEPEPEHDGETDGLLRWTLEVPAGGQAETAFGYSVKYPAARRPRNL